MIQLVHQHSHGWILLIGNANIDVFQVHICMQQHNNVYRNVQLVYINMKVRKHVSLHVLSEHLLKELHAMIVIKHVLNVLEHKTINVQK